MELINKRSGAPSVQTSDALSKSNAGEAQTEHARRIGDSARRDDAGPVRTFLDVGCGVDLDEGLGGLTPSMVRETVPELETPNTKASGGMYETR
jgi:hypothetical protein